MTLIRGDIVTPTGVVAGGAVAIDDRGRIDEIRAVAPLVPDIDAAGYLVVPGFVDMHVHGGGGADFMHGTVDAVRQVARTHARFGTTALLATTLTAAGEQIEAAIAAARDVARDRHGDEARVVGVHLEGPYICPDRRGAQPLEYIRDPDVAELARWIAVGDGVVRQITMAPERPGAEDMVRMAAHAGIIVSVGHTDAVAADVERAAGWGASQATHIFNAMRGVHHREPGAVGGLLVLGSYTAEVIADGVHLHPLIVKLVLEAKGAEGVVLITDAIEGAAMPDGEYALGGNRVIVRAGTASFADGTLAGSVLTMNAAFQNARRWADLTPVEASRIASTNAARRVGRADLGTLEPGKQADIAILDPNTGAVHWTLVAGQVAYKR